MSSVRHFWKLAISANDHVTTLVWKPTGFGIGFMAYKWCIVLPVCVKWEPAYAVLVGLPFTPGLYDCELGRHLDFGFIAFEWRRS